MSKLTTLVLPFFITLFAIPFLGCDDYNIVEPRFYSEDDVHEIVECGYDPFVVDTMGVAGDATGIGLPKLIPPSYAVDACWYNRAEGVMAVYFGLPMSGPVTLSVLNSGGGVEAVLFDGEGYAGTYVLPWVAKVNGVHAISLQTEYWTGVIWFEVDR